jgi:hypothetical protein
VIVLGLGLAAYFWVPALLEKGFVHSERLRESFLQWTEHVLWPTQLLWSPWGYGLSLPGPRDGMSFSLGPAHLALGIAGLLVALRSANRTLRTYALGFAAAAAAGAWLATEWAAPLWSSVGTLQYLAYPWRALILPSLFLPLLIVFALDRLRPRWAVVSLAVLVLLNLPHTEAQGFLTFDDEYYHPQSIATKGLHTTTREEYEPRWVEVRPPYSPNAIIGVIQPVEVTEISRGAARQEFRVRAPAPTAVEASTFFYPGWTAAVDGVSTPISAVPVRGTMKFDVPAGEHQVVLQLRQTPTRRWGLIVTIVTALLLVLVAAREGVVGGAGQNRTGAVLRA